MGDVPDSDVVLSEADEKHREVFEETAERIEKSIELFEEVSEVIELVRSEEITLEEGQERVDALVAESDVSL